MTDLDILRPERFGLAGVARAAVLVVCQWKSVGIASFACILPYYKMTNAHEAVHGFPLPNTDANAARCSITVGKFYIYGRPPSRPLSSSLSKV